MPSRTASSGVRTLPGSLVAVAAALAALAWLALARPAPAQGVSPQAVEDAVVALEVTQQRGDWYSPWQPERPQQSTGSGFVVAPGRILTNAHVVSDARQILVRRGGTGRPYFARVAYIAHDSDLALVEVEDPSFAQDVAPLPLGGLPGLRSRVRTYGYPAGGQKISRTEGVVSRIEFVTYLHSGADRHLAVQTDSAINPGNSGGPVVQDGRVVGVAFQTSSRLNDVGFFIPAPLVRRFLRDVEDGRYDGFAELGLLTSNLVNPAYRSRLGLPQRGGGVVVDQVLAGSSAEGLVRAGDVLRAVGGEAVSADGSVQRGAHELSFEQVPEERLVGETVALRLWRDGAERTVRVVLKPLPYADKLRRRYDSAPHYLVYAGLVFMPLEQELLRTFGNYWENADPHLLYAQFYEHIEREAGFRPHVVLTRVLPHRINSAYRGARNSMVTAVNGVPVRTLADVAAGLQAAEGPYHRFRLAPGGTELVLEREAADAAHEDILSDYGVGAARRLP